MQVQILMAVYKGARYLGAQLDSFKIQTHMDWSLLASIDSPDDGSRAHLEATPNTTILTGPNTGAADNFLHLMRHADAGKVWAFSDQDDIWLENKIARALDRLAQFPDDTPALYCGRSWVVDDSLAKERMSPSLRHPASFANALVQNIAGGNTMVLNGAATRLLSKAAAQVESVVIHDWWIYQMITGAGGAVIHDDLPFLLYRQHGANIIGANDGWRARAARFAMIWNGTWSAWTDTNIIALNANRDLLTQDARAVLNRFAAARKIRNPMSRIIALRATGLYRQSRLAEATMWVAALLGRL